MARVGPSQHQSQAQQHAQNVQLLDGTSWELAADVAAQVLTDAADYMVVGILGTGGTGKSSLANVLCDLTPVASTSSSKPAHDAASAPRLGSSPFLTRSPASTRHGTSGIELRAHATGSGERLVCLDTQPLMSHSLLCDLAAHPSPQELAGSAAATSSLTAALTAALASQQAAGTAVVDKAQAAAVAPELVAALHDLQLATLLLTCCHVVVVMLEHGGDTRVLQLLQAAEVVARSMPDITLPPGASHSSHVALPTPHMPGSGSGAMAAPGGGSQGYVAQVVFVVSGHDPALAGKELALALEAQQRALRLVMCGSGIGARHGCIDVVSEVRWRAGLSTAAGTGKGAKAAARRDSKPATQQQQPQATQGASGEQAGVEAEAAPEPSQDEAQAGRNAAPSSSQGPHVAALVASLPRQHFYALPDPAESSCQKWADGSGAGLAADPGWRTAAQQLKMHLMSLPRVPFARTLSEREMLRAWERAWGSIHASQVLQTHALGMLGLIGGA